MTCVRCTTGCRIFGARHELAAERAPSLHPLVMALARATRTECHSRFCQRRPVGEAAFLQGGWCRDGDGAPAGNAAGYRHACRTARRRHV
jgi:hypothetical protein